MLENVKNLLSDGVTALGGILIVFGLVNLWCVGFVKPCGMPFEQFAPLWLKANFTNDRIFYKPSMRLAGLLSESENSKQKGTIYGKHYRKQGNLRGIESYSPRAGRVIS